MLQWRKAARHKAVQDVGVWRKSVVALRWLLADIWYRFGGRNCNASAEEGVDWLWMSDAVTNPRHAVDT